MPRTRLAGSGGGAVWFDVLEDEAGGLLAVVAHNETDFDARLEAAGLTFRAPAGTRGEWTQPVPAGVAWPPEALSFRWPA